MKCIPCCCKNIIKLRFQHLSFTQWPEDKFKIHAYHELWDIIYQQAIYENRMNHPSVCNFTFLASIAYIALFAN